MKKKSKTLITVLSKIHERRPKASACLVEIYGQQIGRKLLLTQGELIVGRSQKADIQVEQESVSRQHARFRVQANGITVEDMGSTNGTYVNDQPAKPDALSCGDQIKIGRTIYKFLEGEDIESAYRQELLRLAAIDGLTECFNESYLREQLGREVSRAYRYARPLSVVLFDLEGMGRINQELGKLAGDAVLTQLAHRVRSRLRREDVFARLEGGLFAVVAPESGSEDAAALTQKIERIITTDPFFFEEVEVTLGVHTAKATLREEKFEPTDPVYVDAPFETEPSLGKALGDLDVPTAEMSVEDTRPNPSRTNSNNVLEGPSKELFEFALDRLAETKKEFRSKRAKAKLKEAAN
ncbi:MAG: GGDEF domain-containing protein [Myxococcales bacterium]|nr:GGDEF domain-containing protein [Myxococcales bacterium]